jgi:hypothetical protein
MERIEKLELIKRSLGLRHKLKVHDSMKPAETHEDLALSLLARWELEDELRAIEELLAGERQDNVGRKRKMITKDYLGPQSKPASEEEASGEGSSESSKARSKKKRS